MDDFVQAAIEQAHLSYEEGGFPVGAAIVQDGMVIGRGRNRFGQTGDPITHAEIEAIRDAVANSDTARATDSLAGAVCYTTMMPCEMCAGAIIRFGISEVIVAETHSYTDAGTAPLLEKQGIPVEDLGNDACVELVERYFAEHPDISERMRAKRRRLKL